MENCRNNHLSKKLKIVCLISGLFVYLSLAVPGKIGASIDCLPRIKGEINRGKKLFSFALLPFVSL